MKSSSKGSALVEGDAYMTKELSKLFHRIERILIPASSIVENTVSASLELVMLEVKAGTYFQDTYPVESRIYFLRTINWDKLEPVLLNHLGYTLKTVPAVVLDEIRIEQSVQFEKVDKILKKYRLSSLQVTNNDDAVNRS
jgi:hypothetical protein